MKLTRYVLSIFSSAITSISSPLMSLLIRESKNRNRAPLSHPWRSKVLRITKHYSNSSLISSEKLNNNQSKMFIKHYQTINLKAKHVKSFTQMMANDNGQRKICSRNWMKLSTYDRYLSRSNRTKRAKETHWFWIMERKV